MRWPLLGAFLCWCLSASPVFADIAPSGHRKVIRLYYQTPSISPTHRVLIQVSSTRSLLNALGIEKGQPFAAPLDSYVAPVPANKPFLLRHEESLKNLRRFSSQSTRIVALSEKEALQFRRLLYQLSSMKSFRLDEKPPIDGLKWLKRWSDSFPLFHKKSQVSWRMLKKKQAALKNSLPMGQFLASKARIRSQWLPSRMLVPRDFPAQRAIQKFSVAGIKGTKLLLKRNKKIFLTTKGKRLSLETWKKQRSIEMAKKVKRIFTPILKKESSLLFLLLSLGLVTGLLFVRHVLWQRLFQRK